MDLIRIKHVEKKYKNGVTAIYDLNLAIEKANRDVIIDANSLAVGLSRQIDAQLGKMAVAKGRGNV